MEFWLTFQKIGNPNDVQVVMDFLRFFLNGAFTHKNWTIDPSKANAMTGRITVNSGVYRITVFYDVSLIDVQFKTSEAPDKPSDEETVDLPATQNQQKTPQVKNDEFQWDFGTAMDMQK